MIPSKRERYLRLRKEAIKAGKCPVCRIRDRGKNHTTCQYCRDIAKRHRDNNPRVKQYKQNKLK